MIALIILYRRNQATAPEPAPAGVKWRRKPGRGYAMTHPPNLGVEIAMKPTTYDVNPEMAERQGGRIRIGVESVRRSFRTGIAAQPLEYNTFTEADAYNVQYKFLRELQPPETITGHKVALTTKAAREHLGVHEPCYGHILSSCVYANDADVPIASLAAPHIEAETAFVLGHNLRGPGVTPVDVMRATLGILPALELVDLKVQGDGIQATDVIIHNALHGGLVDGSRLIALDSLDLQYEGVTVEYNGELHGTGTGFEVMGNPINPIVWLANKLAEYDDYLRAGETIISGSMVTPVEIKPGDYVKATYSRMGSVGARFVA